MDESWQDGRGFTLAASFSAHLAEMDILIEDLGLPRFVFPYEIPYASSTFPERAEQRQRTWKRLRESGLADAEALHDEDLLTAWADPEMLLTQLASVLDTGARYLYRGGWRNDLGFMSRQEGETLIIERLRPEQVVAAMVGFLPDWPALRVRPVTTTTAPPSRRPDDEAEPLPVTEEPADVRGAEHFLTAPVLRYGMMACTAREPGTGLRRATEHALGAMTWIDTSDGRFFIITEDLPDGSQRRSYVPADNTRLAQWLRERFNAVLAS
ncbi:EspG family protein [Amycolatopsis arida]|uniref:EspG family protein n=1 Tax=Amycolatopsis arida TaxID=587909 RepID=A0A1I5PFE2_9PSEU|nr:ESAT-6 protein secretion system EspG family protein [Amycolatopsis arida]SFP32814.1 EspG family protein [Amycolatopsis arida]